MTERDLTPEEINDIARQMSAALAPICKRHRIKFVVAAAAQKNSDPELGTSFVLVSHPEDPMWSVTALANAAKALLPSAEAQRIVLAKAGA